MNSLKVRVTLSESVTKKDIKTLFKKHSEAYMYAYEEDANRPHIQAYILTSVTSQHLRKSLRELGLKGNKDYSIKNNDETYPIEYLSYLMKEGNYKTHNIPEDVWEQVVTHQEEVKESMKEKKNSKKTQLESLKEAMETLPPDEKIVTMNMLVRFVLKYYKGKLIREFHLISLIQSLALDLNIKVTINGNKIPYEEFFYEKLMSKVL